MLLPHNRSSRRGAQSGFVPITTLLFIVFLLIVVTGAFGLWVAFTALVILWISSYLAIGCGVLPRYLSVSLQRDFPVTQGEPPDCPAAIILLGAGTSPQELPGLPVPAWESHSRIEKAAQLYLATKKGGFRCTLVISGGDVSRSVAVTNAVYSPRLIALGVAPPDILLENVGVNSYQHAQFTKKILQTQCNYNKLYLVTSGLHMKRALLYFAHHGVQPIPVSSDYVTGVLSLLPFGFNFAVAEIAWHQYIGIARLRLYNALGWN